MPQPRHRSPLQTAAARTLGPLRLFFSAYDAEESDARRFRARQLEALLRLTPLAMVINVLNAVVIDIALWAHASHTVLLIWSVGIALMAGAGLRGWFQSRRRRERSVASRRALRHAAISPSACRQGMCRRTSTRSPAPSTC